MAIHEFEGSKKLEYSSKQVEIIIKTFRDEELYYLGDFEKYGYQAIVFWVTLSTSRKLEFDPYNVVRFRFIR